jgi:hypothetical protein
MPESAHFVSKRQIPLPQGASTIMIDRRRSWEQLHRLADAGNEQAIAGLEALQGFTLD